MVRIVSTRYLSFDMRGRDTYGYGCLDTLDEFEYHAADVELPVVKKYRNSRSHKEKLERDKMLNRERVRRFRAKQKDRASK